MKSVLTGVVLALIGAALLTLTACTPQHHTASTAEEKLATKQAQTIVSACVGKSGGSIKATEKCLAPGGPAAKAKFESCAAHAAIYFTDKGKFESALDNCVVNDR